MDDVTVTFYERLGDALSAGLNKKQLRERINADSEGAFCFSQVACQLV